MALVVKDRVKETTTTIGTGTLTLLGAATGFQAFSVIGDGNTTYYAITNGTDWEVGVGTYTSSGTTLSRDTILESSNSGSAVDWGVGAKDVFVTYPAEKAIYFNAADQLDVDNLRLDGNTLSSTNTDGNIVLDPDGTGSVDVSSAKIINVASPTSDNDAVNKTYVDTLVAAGIHFHDPVRVESPINLTASYNNGSSGVGATLTNSGTQAALVIDGITVNTSDRVLIYQQTDQTQNGVYVVTDTGSVSTNWVLTRSTDTDTYGIAGPDTLSEGSTFFVQEGDTGAGETYTCNTVGTITFGTTNITFAQISSAQIYSAGAGLDLTGTQFSVETNGITDAMLRQSAGLSVIGRSANTTGDVADITAASDNEVLRRSGTSIGFGSVATGGIADNAVTDAKIRDSAALSVIGNATNSTANPADIAAASDHEVLRRSGTSLGFGAVALDQAAAVTGALSFANGGTGQATQQAAMNALAGAITSGQYLRGNGTNVVMSSIQAGDVPTLNQNTTGNAATATALQTARTIGGVSFNGTANINLPGVNTAGNQNTSGNAATATTATNLSGGTVNTTGITSSGNILPATDNTGVVGNAANTWSNGQFTSLTIDSTLSVRGAVDLADNDILRLGSSDDWEMFHNGTDNYMDLNVGNLIIRDNTTTRFTFGRTTGNIVATGSIDCGTQFLGLATDAVTAPSFSWTGDTNTGIYRPTTDTVGIVCGGTEDFRVDSTGQLWNTVQSQVGTDYTTLYKGYFARAWVSFNGTGTPAIRASGNVTSITDNGVGDFTVNITTAMPDVNYATLVMGGRSTNDTAVACLGYISSQAAPTTSNVRIRTNNPAVAYQDVDYVAVAIFR